MNLAKGDVTKVKQVIELTAEECLLNLKYEAEKALINQKREDIIKRRSKTK